jgi:hypothetical protein
MAFFKRIITAPLYVIAAIIILLEDWLWDDLQKLGAALGRLPIFRQIEAFIISVPPIGAVFLFILPSVLLIPVKLAAVWFISTGHAITGVATMVLAKIAGTAIVARLFKLTKPKLLQFSWFAAIYARITTFKARLYENIKSTRIYRYLHKLISNKRKQWQQWRSERKSWFKRRWLALRHLIRKKSQ